ncbi:MAG: sulfatase [Planctomycetota bacterium]|nr:sulfatase [Planctomycetota bacterium]
MNWIKALLVCCFLITGSAQAAEQPNILWIVCEDSSIDWFGCYGNKYAKTPNVDALAKQGFRYKNAYACVPVCAPSRSTWITGIYSASTGTLPMDSNKANAWDLRKPGQPFFQILNFTESHESKAHGAVTNTRHSPNDIILRKYHPDEKGIRMTYAKYHDAVETMDIEVGKALAALDKAGLANDTIVIFNSDHGGVMPRSKRFLYNSGLHCPLIVRMPEKYKHLWPGKSPGETVDRLVSFVDMPKTWLSLANAEIPPAMQGKIFLGTKAQQEPEYVFSFRERMDERFDNQRAVRSKQFLYIKNFMPYAPWGQHVDYLWKMEATKVWEDAYKNKRTNEITGRFFNTKPVEELYDMQTDPDNVVNLADKPEHRETLLTMRGKLKEWQLAIRDAGLLPEFERNERAAQNKTTIYQMAQNEKLYDLPAYLDAADLALAKNSVNKPKLLELLKSKDSGLRYHSGAVHAG